MPTEITITPAEAPALILDVLRTTRVPMICSSPGLGKSSIIQQVAKEQNLKVIDLRLAQCDPTDLSGFPFVDKEAGKASYMPMDTFPIEGDSLPRRKDEDGNDLPVKMNADNQDENEYAGWLLFLDEFTSAPMSVQAAAYKIVLDHQVGQHNLHKRVKMVCAGNLASDRAIVNRLSTAMQSRLIHFEMVNDVKGWLDWANLNDIDFRVTSYINFKNERLHDFSPDHADKTFPCPRTWEFVSDIIKPWKSLPVEKTPIIAGTVGEGVALEFTSFCAIYDKLPSFQEILANPTGVLIPTQPDVCYAISGLIGANANISNIEKIIPAVLKMDIEFQIISLNGAIKKNPKIMQLPGIRTWITDNAKDMV